jgi:hypothetical protein
MYLWSRIAKREYHYSGFLARGKGPGGVRNLYRINEISLKISVAIVTIVTFITHISLVTDFSEDLI